MRTHGDARAAAAIQLIEECARNAQLRLRAAPEQIGGRGGDHCHVGTEVCHQLRRGRISKLQRVRVDQYGLVAGRFEQRPRIAELER
jgi:hypothetical protein